MKGLAARRPVASCFPHRVSLPLAKECSIIVEMPPEPMRAHAAALPADGRWLAMGAGDKRTQLWNLEEEGR